MKTPSLRGQRWSRFGTAFTVSRARLRRRPLETSNVPLV